MVAGVSSFIGSTSNFETVNETVLVKKASDNESAESNDFGVVSDELSVSIRSIMSTDLMASVTVQSGFTEEAAASDPQLSYYLGYGTSDEDVVNASLVYYVETPDGKKEQRISPFNRSSANGYYDGLGALNQDTVTNTVDIPLNPGEKVLTDSFLVTNYFKGIMNSETNQFEPERNGDGTLKVYCSTPTMPTAFRDYTLDHFLELEYAGSTTYNGYNSIIIDVKANMTNENYEKLSTSTRRVYGQNEDRILQGLSWVRTRLSLNYQTLFYIYLKDQIEPLIVESSPGTIDVTSGNSIILTFEGFNPKDIANINIYNYYVYVDIFDSESHKGVTSSQYSARFGNTDVALVDLVYNGEVIKESVDNVYFVNLNYVMGFTTLGFTIVYFAISIFVYFYLKNKNKNDEFKKMRTRPYWTNNVLGYILCGSALLTILSISFRATLFANSLSVFNPFDAIIIVFAVSTIIFGGYFIRYFAIQIKNIIDKNRIEKLKLNQNRIDDGTLLITSAKEKKE